MIRVAVKQGLLGEEIGHYVRDGGRTARQILDEFAGALPRSVPTLVAVDGELVEGDALDAPLENGQQVVLLPQTAGAAFGAFLVQALITVLVSAAISYVAYLLSPRPKAPGVAQDRGDDTSQTYSWDGIKTNTGPGLPIPWGYGRHAVGGQVIWSDVEASRNVAGQVDDRLRLLLSLCEGPIHRVGDVLAGDIDELGGFISTPGAAPFLDGVRVNGNAVPATANAGARAWIRPGTQGQSPLPEPFRGVSTVQSVQRELTPTAGPFGVTETIDVDGPLSSVRVVLTFPSGIYQIGSSGQPTGLDVFVSGFWKPANVPPPVASPPLPQQVVSTAAGGPRVGFFAYTATYDFTGVEGPIEINLRISVAQGTQVVAQCIWRDLVVTTPNTLRYPLEALLGLELQANARFEGGLPNVEVRCDLAQVRVWDAVNGWSPRCWDVPAAPFDFHTHPPGRNPAWCLLDFLLARWGLGNWITEDQVDLPAFRRWAVFCDEDPNPADPWGEPGFTVDVVGDRPRPAWEWVLAFCAAGRAAPIIRNGKISVVYQYRDAHSDGTVSVPAKAPVQLITAGNCEDVQVTWLPLANRPTVYQFQFLDEEQAYTQDVFPVEDDGGTLNDPSALRQEQYRPEVVQAYGITRKSQLFREGLWRHRIQRLVRREITFTTGPWALAAEVGDLIEFQDEVMRPFGADVPTAMQVILGTSGGSQFVVDHHLSGSGLQAVWRDENGAPQRVAIDSYVNGTQDNGRPLSVVNVLPTITVPNGAAVVIGIADKIVETYEIASITLQKDLRRTVRALQWTPEAYEPIDQAAFLEGLPTDDPVDPILDEPTTDTLPPSVLGASVRTELDGSHTITFARPASREITPARVYLRGDAASAWRFLGETTGSTLPVGGGLLAGRSYEVSICLQNMLGQIVEPELGDVSTIVPEEFPNVALPQLTGVRATLLEQGALVQFDELAQRDLDYFEVRYGSSWAAGQVLSRERAPRALLEAAPGGAPLMVAARSRSGLYGPIAVVPNPGWSPPDRATIVEVDEFATSPGGTHTNTVWNETDQVIELAAGVRSGTYVSAEIDLGYQAPAFWRVQIDREEIEDVAIDDLAIQIGSGEARWRTIDGRPASPAAPGIDWQTTIDDLALPIVDVPSTLLIAGHVGEVGSHTQVFVETRFYVDGAWTAYRPHVDRVVVASRMQVRLTLNRRELFYRARVALLSYQVNL